MLNRKLKLVLTISLMVLIVTGISFAQDKGTKEHKMDKKSSQMMDHKKMDQKLMMDTSKTVVIKEGDSIVRKGVIDLNAIDKNEDGKVFQDVMDFNVISDEPGTCPICEMKLKEVTLNEAKFNLIKNGFEVK